MVEPGCGWHLEAWYEHCVYIHIYIYICMCMQLTTSERQFLQVNVEPGGILALYAHGPAHIATGSKSFMDMANCILAGRKKGRTQALANIEG